MIFIEGRCPDIDMLALILDELYTENILCERTIPTHC